MQQTLCQILLRMVNISSPVAVLEKSEFLRRNVEIVGSLYNLDECRFSAKYFCDTSIMKRQGHAWVFRQQNFHNPSLNQSTKTFSFSQREL